MMKRSKQRAKLRICHESLTSAALVMVTAIGCSGELPDAGASKMLSETNVDGSKTTSKPDGSRVTESPDGTVTTEAPDGTIRIENPDGSVTVKNPDGSVTVEAPDGTITTVPAPDSDGTELPDVGGVPGCVPGVTPTSQLSRLTGSQYDRTTNDLLGLNGTPSQMLAPDSTASVAQRDWDGYQVAAKALAAEVMGNAQAKAKLLTCAEDTSACAQELVVKIGARAFRRPLTDSEVTRYQALYENRAQLTETGSFDEAVQLIVEAFLSSPYFITVAELSEAQDGDSFVLDAYEVASRLSYMLWGTMPDETLFAAAAAGELATADQIRTQALRMLGDARARELVLDFHRMYTNMTGATSRWQLIDHDTSKYPHFSPEQVPVLYAEAERFFDTIVFEEGGSFQELMTSTRAYVNADTAPLYGLTPSDFGSELEPVELDDRPGMFTKAGFLTAFSKFDSTSPILRGAFIQKNILCTPMGAPPPGASDNTSPTDGAVTVREVTDAKTAAGDCKTCHHTIINPTGFLFESFDATGKLQTTDNGEPINTVASVYMGDEGFREFSGAADFAQALAESPSAQRCYAQNWVQFAYNRSLSSADVCTVDSMTEKLTAGGYSVRDLIADLTQSDSFRLRAVDTE
jgi:hypothetical protein